MKRKAIFHNILGAFSNFAFLFLASIVLLPYYFRFIPVSDYGIWLGGISFLTLVSVLEANISFILTQQLGERWTEKDRVGFSKYLSAAMLFGIVASFVVIVSVYLIRYELAAWVHAGENHREVFAQSFFLYAISLCLTFTFGYLNSVTQVFLRTLLSPVFNLIGAAAGILFTILAIPHYGILAIAGGNLIKSGIYSILVAIYVGFLMKEKNIRFSFGSDYVFRLLRSITLPFISKVGMTLAVSIQNFIVAAMISTTATTIFDITKKLPLMVQMLANMVTVATFTSFTLFYAEQKSREGTHEYTRSYFTLVRIILLVTLALVFIIGQDFVTLWVGADKFGGNFLLGLLCITALTDQLRLMLAQQYYAIGEFNLTSVTDGVFALSFMVFALILIPVMQVTGVVLAGILANTTYFFLCHILEKRKHILMFTNVINRNFFSDLGLALPVVALAMLGYNVFRGNIFMSLIIASMAFFILSLIFYLKEKALFGFIVLKFGIIRKNK